MKRKRPRKPRITTSFHEEVKPNDDIFRLQVRNEHSVSAEIRTDFPRVYRELCCKDGCGHSVSHAIPRSEVFDVFPVVRKHISLDPRYRKPIVSVPSLKFKKPFLRFVGYPVSTYGIFNSFLTRNRIINDAYSVDKKHGVKKPDLTVSGEQCSDTRSIGKLCQNVIELGPIQLHLSATDRTLAHSNVSQGQNDSITYRRFEKATAILKAHRKAVQRDAE